MLGWDVELALTRLARDRVVDANEIVLQLAVHRAIPLVSAGRDPFLLRAAYPPHLVVIAAAAPRTRVIRGPHLRFLSEEVALLESHGRRISDAATAAARAGLGRGVLAGSGASGQPRISPCRDGTRHNADPPRPPQ